MIAAGTQIELSIGVTFGISTMAGYVEALASRLGLQVPDLTAKQVHMWPTRLSSHLGKALGITIGCILGMFPLLFLVLLFNAIPFVGFGFLDNAIMIAAGTQIELSIG
ncbi:hypothetical protein CRUP_032465, partial [Coryphaenoides rupestris]